LLASQSIIFSGGGAQKKLESLPQAQFLSHWLRELFGHFPCHMGFRVKTYVSAPIQMTIMVMATITERSKWRKMSIVEKMAEASAEREAHRRVQDDKNRQLEAALRAIEEESARENHSVTETKKTLLTDDATDRNVQRLKAERRREVERETGALELQERLSHTWHSLELNSTAHQLDAWCNECGCLHTSVVVNGGGGGEDDHL
jgi:hypothetical protein